MAEAIPLAVNEEVQRDADGQPTLVDSTDPLNETHSKELREELQHGFLAEYKPRLTVTNNVDKIGRYTIDTKRPLMHLDTSNAKAFEAFDEGSREKKLYVLICSKHLPARQALAKRLLKAENCPLVKLFAEGVTHISSMNEQRYVLIYEQPLGQTLHDVIFSQPQAFSDSYTLAKALVPLNHALSVIEQLGHSHGTVHPKNIYIHEGQLTLGECCSEPYGYSQDFHYEPINYIQTHPAGKGNGGPGIDYYALGVIAALMKLKPKSLTHIPNREQFLRRLLQEGSYIGIAGYIDLSDEMNDLLRGTLNDNAPERWTSEQVTPWCKGKRYNLLTPNIPSLGARPFEFGDTNYQNLRQLANAIYHAWDKAIPILQDGSLARWVELSTRRREISEYLNGVVKSYRSITAQAAREIITRSIFALDRVTPIRLQSLSMFPDGVNILLTDIYHQQDEALLTQLKEAIVQSMFSAWQDSQRSNFGTHEASADMQQAIWALDRSRLNINNNAAGFGIERLLYDLNKTLPCQSPIVKSHFAANLTDLLVALDHVAISNERPDTPMDKHIAAFIGAHAPLNSTLRFDEYAHYPHIANHEGFKALKFLEKAQKTTKNLRFPGLAAWLVASMTEAIGSFHSHTIRKELCARLSELVKEGDLSRILEYLTAYDYSAADSQGFTAATAQHTQLGAKVIGLQDEQLLEFRAYKMGNMIAKIAAYAMLVGMAIYYFNLD